MRLPRVRFTVRRMMLAVAIAALAPGGAESAGRETERGRHRDRIACNDSRAQVRDRSSKRSPTRADRRGHAAPVLCRAASVPLQCRSPHGHPALEPSATGRPERRTDRPVASTGLPRGPALRPPRGDETIRKGYSDEARHGPGTRYRRCRRRSQQNRGNPGDGSGCDDGHSGGHAGGTQGARQKRQASVASRRQKTGRKPAEKQGTSGRIGRAARAGGDATGRRGNGLQNRPRTGPASAGRASAAPGGPAKHRQSTGKAFSVWPRSCLPSHMSMAMLPLSAASYWRWCKVIFLSARPFVSDSKKP
jgi:hypothetical protein